MKWLIISIVLLLTSLQLQAQKSYIYQNSDGAIKGYDPVAYFVDKKPVKGDPSISYKWMEVEWYFSNPENLELFKSNPEKYAPQYGGYCAYSVAKGYTAKVDPEVYQIIDGKLYLNYNESVQKNWKEYLDRYIVQAGQNWPAVLSPN